MNDNRPQLGIGDRSTLFSGPDYSLTGSPKVGGGQTNRKPLPMQAPDEGRMYAGGPGGYFGPGGERRGGAGGGWGYDGSGINPGEGQFRAQTTYQNMDGVNRSSSPFNNTGQPTNQAPGQGGNQYQTQSAGSPYSALNGGASGPDYVSTNPGAPNPSPSAGGSAPPYEYDSGLEASIPGSDLGLGEGVDFGIDPRAQIDPLDLFSGRGTRAAADRAMDAERRAQGEIGRQFDVTQEQNRPYREAGERGLSQYEDLINRRNEYGVESNLPSAYQSETNIPEFGFDSGNYSMGQGNVEDGFQFGQNEFNQYKDPGYEFNVEESLRGLDRNLASRGKRRAGIRDRALMEKGQDLASNEFGQARGRAKQDYNASVGRERTVYGRGVQDYGRRVGREAELYGRGRNAYQDATNQEQTMSDRDFTDYTSRVGREEGVYNRSLEGYARDYVDPMNRFAQLSGLGQGTALGLGQLRQSYAQNIGNSANRIGDIQAMSGLGQARGYAQAANTIGSYFNQPGRGFDNNAYNPLDDPSSVEYNNP